MARREVRDTGKGWVLQVGRRGKELGDREDDHECCL